MFINQLMTVIHNITLNMCNFHQMGKRCHVNVIYCVSVLKLKNKGFNPILTLIQYCFILWLYRGKYETKEVAVIIFNGYLFCYIFLVNSLFCSSVIKLFLNKYSVKNVNHNSRLICSCVSLVIVLLHFFKYFGFIFIKSHF